MVKMENSQLADRNQPIKRVNEKISRGSRSRAVYMKRKDCIKKKTMELATLCGIDACTVLIGPDGREVETWPENSSAVRAVIERYKECCKSGSFNVKKKVRKPSGLKITEEIKIDAAKRANLGCWDDAWLDGFSTDSLSNFFVQLEGKLEAVTSRIEYLKMVSEQNRAVGSETLGVGNLSDPYNAMVSFDALTSSATPIWPPQLNCLGDSTSCNGGDFSVAPWTFGDGLEKMSNVNDWNNCGDLAIITAFDAPEVMSSATPVWRFNCSGDLSSSSNISVAPWTGLQEEMNNVCYRTNCGDLAMITGFDAPEMTSSATPIWRFDCSGDLASSNISVAPWMFGEISGAYNLWV